LEAGLVLTAPPDISSVCRIGRDRKGLRDYALEHRISLWWIRVAVVYGVPDTGPVLSRSKNSKSKFNRLSRFDFAADAVSRQWTTCNPFVAFELLNINGSGFRKDCFAFFKTL
jgi:hypothetical protein